MPARPATPTVRQMGIVLTIVLSLVLVTAVATFSYRAWRQPKHPPPARQRPHRKRRKRRRRA